MTHNSKEFKTAAIELFTPIFEEMGLPIGVLEALVNNQLSKAHQAAIEAAEQRGADIAVAAQKSNEAQIKTAIRASNKALLEEIKSAFPYEAYINNIDGKWLLEVLDAKLAAIDKEAK